MLNKILKSLLVIGSTLSVTVLLGIIFFGKSFGVMLPDGFTGQFFPGLAVTAVGVLVALASSVFILRYFIFFTRMRVVDSEGNTLTDNKSLIVGSLKVHPILIAAGGVLLSMIIVGLGFCVMFDNVTKHVITLLTIAGLILIIAAIIFFFSVIGHKIRRRFAWIASGIMGIVAVVIILSTIPAISDLSVKDSELSAITATVVQTSPYSGFLAGPGRSVIRIKGTSGEMISLKYSGSRSEFQVGNKYTFYYLPHTHLIKKVTPADKIQY